jgi:hypothetical protein
LEIVTAKTEVCDRDLRKFEMFGGIVRRVENGDSAIDNRADANFAIGLNLQTVQQLEAGKRAHYPTRKPRRGLRCEFAW